MRTETRLVLTRLVCVGPEWRMAFVPKSWRPNSSNLFRRPANIFWCTVPLFGRLPGPNSLPGNRRSSCDHTVQYLFMNKDNILSWKEIQKKMLEVLAEHIKGCINDYLSAMIFTHVTWSYTFPSKLQNMIKSNLSGGGGGWPPGPLP